jgi:hypothetical protein
MGHTNQLSYLYAGPKVSPKRYQAARSWMSSGRVEIMLEDWEVFGPTFPSWAQAHEHAVSVMTNEERAAHRRTDDDECGACGLSPRKYGCGGDQRPIGSVP